VPYDFTDEGVYALIKGTHRPTEIGGMRVQTLSGYSPETMIDPLRLVCEKDGEDWPCTAVAELRAFDEKKKQAQQSGEEIIKRRIAEGKILG
jgi:hypothetical protein